MVVVEGADERLGKNASKHPKNKEPNAFGCEKNDQINAKVGDKEGGENSVFLVSKHSSSSLRRVWASQQIIVCRMRPSKFKPPAGRDEKTRLVHAGSQTSEKFHDHLLSFLVMTLMIDRQPLAQHPGF